MTRVVWRIRFFVQDVFQFHDTTPGRSNRIGFDCRRHRSPQVRLRLLHRECTREGFWETQTVFCHLWWAVGLVGEKKVSVSLQDDPRELYRNRQRRSVERPMMLAMSSL
jgi:hypothetical protein